MAPENTLKAVRRALESGVGFEVDLQRLRSGEVIVLHDDTLRRTAAPRFGVWPQLARFLKREHVVLDTKVDKLSLEEVRRVQVGDELHNEPVPLFTDILQELARPPPLNGNRTSLQPSESYAHCFAELKSEAQSMGSGFDAKLIESAARAVRESAVAADRLTWISFSLGALLEVKRRLRHHQALLIAHVRSETEAWRVAKTAHAANLDGIDLNADPKLVTRELVDWMHARNRLVAVWVYRARGSNEIKPVWEATSQDGVEAPVSNDIEPVWEAMSQHGVDYFTSNLPPEVHTWRLRSAKRSKKRSRKRRNS